VAYEEAHSSLAQMSGAGVNMHRTSEEPRQAATGGNPGTTSRTGDHRAAGLSRRALPAGAAAAGAGLAAGPAGILPGIRPTTAGTAVTAGPDRLRPLL
jgi:hypothetical protein